VTGYITKGPQPARIDKAYEIFIYNINKLPNKVTGHEKEDENDNWKSNSH